MRWSIVLLFAGCYSPTAQPGAPCSALDTCPSGLACEGGVCVRPGEGEADAAIDSPPAIDMASDSPTVIDGCTSFSQQFDTCALPAGTQSMLLSGAFTYNTDTHVLRDVNNNAVPVTTRRVNGLAGPIDVIVVSSLTFGAGASLRAIGSVPFGVVATEDMTIAGKVDVTIGGAGARDIAACGASAGGTHAVANPGGGAGGGGGGFRGKGGRGGNGDTNNIPQPGGAAGEPILAPAGPLGGCPGGKGQNGVAIGGDGGAGGGAIFLLSRTSITVASTGQLLAGGGGGLGGKIESSGGGGGGSGGAIWIEAPIIQIAGVATANGGGGAEGASEGNAGDNGDPGRADAADAQGGSGLAGDGGDGGDGSAAAALAGDDGVAMADNGGGGGGGAAGFLVFRGNATVTGTVSPTP